jgi:hypothetical protein
MMKNRDLNFDLQSAPCTVKNNILKICFQRFNYFIGDFVVFFKQCFIATIVIKLYKVGKIKGDKENGKNNYTKTREKKFWSP